MVFNATFNQQYFSYIVAVSFLVEETRELGEKQRCAASLRGKRFTYVPKSRLFWGRFGSRYVEAAYDTNDMMLIFLKKKWC